MGLLDFLKKPTNSSGERLDRLTPEGELPWGWHYANREFTERLEQDYMLLSDSLSAAKRQGVLQKYAALKSLVVFMEDAGKLCRSKGECFEKWSLIIVSNPVVLEENKTELRYMAANMDALLKTEKVLTKLKAELKDIIRKEPGIVQSELYKRFDPSVKNHISNELYQMEIHNVVVREKSGRSYKLYMK